MSLQAAKPALDLKLIRLTEAARRADGPSVDTLTRRAARAGIIRQVAGVRMVPAAAVAALAANDTDALRQWAALETEGAL